MATYNLMYKTVDLMPFSNNISWNSDADTLGTQLSFECVKDIDEGSVINLFINGVEYFRGVIINKTEGRWYFSYVVNDYSFYLKNKTIKQFNKIPASDAISSIMGECYIQADVVSIPTKINKIYKTSYADMIDDILEQAQADQGVEYFKEIDVTTLRIKQVQDQKIAPKIILPDTIDIESSIEKMKNKIIVTSTGDESAKVYAAAEDTTYQWFYGVLSDVIEIEDKDVAQAQNMANNMLSKYNKIFKNTTFEVIAVEGAETIKANRLLYISIGKRLNSFCKIKSATHTLSNGLHKVNINVEW